MCLGKTAVCTIYNIPGARGLGHENNRYTGMHGTYFSSHIYRHWLGIGMYCSRAKTLCICRVIIQGAPAKSYLVVVLDPRLYLSWLCTSETVAWLTGSLVALPGTTRKHMTDTKGTSISTWLAL